MLVQKGRLCVALIHISLEAFCHAFNRYERVRSALLSEIESQIDLLAQEINRREVVQRKEKQCLPSRC